MADGSAPETSSPKITKVESGSSKVWRSIREKFSKKTTTTPRNDSHPEQFAEFIDVYPEKKFTVAGFIAREIRKKGLKPPYFESHGATDSIYETNERVNPELLVKLRNQKQAPDGYLVAVGGGNWASLLDAFPKDKPPKGIVLINIDPNSIAKLETLVGALRGDTQIPEDIKYWEIYQDLPEEEYFGHVYNNGENTVFTRGVLGRHLSLLTRLAREGNIAIVQQDVLDPQLLDLIARLPNYPTLNNVVGLSNISDWQRRAAYRRRMDEMIKSGNMTNSGVDIDEINRPFVPLEKLKSGPGNKSYFVDSTEKSLRYRIRISSDVPKFRKGDFDSHSGEPNFQIPDQIEGSSLNAEGEFRSMHYLSVLREFYRLKEDPDYKHAMQQMREKINKLRAGNGNPPLANDTDPITGLGYELRLVEINDYAHESQRPADPRFRLYPVNENNWIYWVTSNEVIKMAQLYNRLFSETHGGVPPGSTADYLAELIMNTYRIDPAEVKPPFS